ncbi:Uncharacterized protein/domain, possibly involved in tellurite resistance [Raoultella planticola]|uniref:Uncharacterized protein/domain, possibly involved in tellurite resistance n=1 Tax=Raoultella planticola TaxID=575 RepID=A0A485D0G6_RAOPL|nr:Uncharacterized protein/domain, possibly involved in tellurite resistance [Raoultella planticola]
MQRIIIPTHYVHTRTTPLWTKETAPASIWQRHLDAGTRQGVYPRLAVMQGLSAITAMPMRPARSRWQR